MIRFIRIVKHYVIVRSSGVFRRSICSNFNPHAECRSNCNATNIIKLKKNVKLPGNDLKTSTREPFVLTTTPNRPTTKPCSKLKLTHRCQLVVENSLIC